MAADPESDLEAYAALRARLADETVDREVLLAEFGLDEDSWDQIDDRWQQRLSDDLDSVDDDVPPSIVHYSNAFVAAQKAAGAEIIELETFARCTRAIQGARDPRLALEKLGVSLSDYLRANQRWLPEMAQDAALAARFQQAMKKG